MSNIILVENRDISTYHTLFKQFRCFDFAPYASLQNDNLQAGLDDYRFDAYCQMIDNTDFLFDSGSVYLIINVELSEEDKADGISLAHHIRLHDWQKNKVFAQKECKIFSVSDRQKWQDWLETGFDVNWSIIIHKGASYFNSNEFLKLLKNPLTALESPLHTKEVVDFLDRIAKITKQDITKYYSEISIPAPKGIGRHSLANEWGVLRLASSAGISLPDFTTFPHLYFKYKTCKTAKNDTISPIKINKTISVLMVDDKHDKGWSACLQLILLDNAVTTTKFDTVKTKNEAIEKIKTENYDLVFLDLRLDGDEDKKEVNDLQGFDILQKIKSGSDLYKSNPATQVIIFTASNKAWNLEKLKQAGADGYFIKEDPDLYYGNNFSDENYKNLLETIQTCITKGEILQKYWSKTINMTVNMNVIDGNIKSRITDKLNYAFSVLRTTQTDYEKLVLSIKYNSYDLAFIIYFSCLNEFMEDKMVRADIVPPATKAKIELKDKDGIPHTFYNDIANKLEIQSEEKTYLAFFPSDAERKLSDTKTFEWSINQMRFSKNYLQPNETVAGYLLFSGITGNGQEIKNFNKLRLIRNQHDFTHSDENAIKNQPYAENIYAKEDCELMIDFLEYLITLH